MKAYPLVLTIFLIASCQKDQEIKQSRGEVDSLYRETIELTDRYIDSLTKASDSQATRLFREFNTQLNRLNSDVSPDTDLLLTEAQNDTIAIKLDILRKLFDSRLVDNCDSLDIEPDTLVNPGL